MNAYTMNRILNSNGVSRLSALWTKVLLGLVFASCLLFPSANSHAQSLPLYDDFEDGDAEGWVARSDYSALGMRDVVDGDFVLTGNQRGSGLDADWGNAVYEDVSIHALFQITAEDGAGVYARSTLEAPNGTRIGYQPWGFLEGNGQLTVGLSQNQGVSFLKQVSTGWDPTGQDVHMQFNVLGRQSSLTAWLDGAEKPQPQIVVDLPTHVDEGRIGIWTYQPNSGALGPVAFRFVEASELLPITCDFDFDRRCSTADLGSRSLFRVNLVDGSSRKRDTEVYDLTGDGSVDRDDLTYWLSAAATRNGFAAPYVPGDTNLDGTVNFTDFLALANGFGGRNRDWANGNLDGDRDVDFSDFLALSEHFGTTLEVGQASAVPEPTAGGLGLVAVLSGLILTRQLKKQNVVSRTGSE